MDSPAEALARARELVLRHGWNSTAYQILNPGIRHWFSPEGDAVVGFVDRYGVRVVAGAPICPAERMAAVVERFETETTEEGLEICYFCAGTRLLTLGGDDEHCAVIIGAQPAWDPDDWEEMLGSRASLRAQLNRARNKGVEVSEWSSVEAAGDPRLRICLDEWLSTKGLPPLHFLVETRTLERIYDRRVFVAEREREVVGFLVASPIPARKGWLIEQVVRGPGAPNGTAELLIDAAVRGTGAEGCHYLTLGLSPLSTHAGALGEGGPRWLRFMLGWMRAHVHRFYNFEGLEAFKAKFRPAVWEPIFAVASGPRFTLRILYAVADAFSDRSVPSTVGRALLGATRQELHWARAGIIRTTGAPASHSREGE